MKKELKKLLREYGYNKVHEELAQSAIEVGKERFEEGKVWFKENIMPFLFTYHIVGCERYVKSKQLIIAIHQTYMDADNKIIAEDICVSESKVMKPLRELHLTSDEIIHIINLSLNRTRNGIVQSTTSLTTLSDEPFFKTKELLPCSPA